ncbi:intradiol ring-cleavage dioxygenase [Aquabacterium sp.]|uniref:intradiol ring-cleavage dioxygenase n=1 Tax=Aquabacterium sp. TaxID=1872578 RepID=UPI002BF84EDA|nr:intradiol ring-cleavage dioxygenase [Aquabacterium sp.]HSW08923.1 intradiol ring-cleavage dioxygenase [Aquabacterium sp.]
MTPNPLLLRRRGALGALSGLSAIGLIGCGGAEDSSSATTATPLDAATDGKLERILAASTTTCTLVAEEVEGPYPLRAILSNTAMVRSNITEGKTGVALTLRLKLVDVNNACAPISGASVYIWHCDKDGLYSGYDASNNAGQAGLTYLRGVQVSDSTGRVTFTTIFPGWYAGRITHIHAMVFLAGSSLGSSSTAMATTQFAFPPAVTTAVYNSALYTKGQNTSVTSFSADNIFSDGTGTELLTLSGSASAGYAGGLVLGIDQTATSSGGGSGGGTPPTPPTGPRT